MPGRPPPHPPCLPKSATPSACTWTTSCELTESGTPISWRTHTCWPGRRCVTTGALCTYKRTSIGQSSKPRLDRESQRQLSNCSPSPIPATFGMSEFAEYTDAHKHTYSMNILLYGWNIKGCTVSLWGDLQAWMWNNACSSLLFATWDWQLVIIHKSLFTL